MSPARGQLPPLGPLRPAGSERRPEPLAARIERQLARGADGHWRWQGQTTADGYPAVYAGRLVLVRRYLWEQAHGPLAGRVLRRGCDAADCVNPAHLAPTTRAELARANRLLPGGPTRLSWAAVRDARARAAAGSRPQALAAAYGVGERHMRRILRGERWRLTRPDHA